MLLFAFTHFTVNPLIVLWLPFPHTHQNIHKKFITELLGNATGYKVCTYGRSSCTGVVQRDRSSGRIKQIGWSFPQTLPKPTDNFNKNVIPAKSPGNVIWDQLHTMGPDCNDCHGNHFFPPPCILDRLLLYQVALYKIATTETRSSGHGWL